MNAGLPAGLPPQPRAARRVPAAVQPRRDFMRGALLWLIGIPIPVIIALWLFGVL
ncbi:hypothetical protein [Sediminicoccus rosea]|jgi:hypothetical protein|uniref:Uncharacterized protein n=1 Tax=Sediminicoccus rosea TaxID=1225128 RepID=A0ABZ0PL76_9PROT|nr:hypothetical protein [Sediminicoccus rosea]WPB86490.1 hypothetical protein R9Z33_06340 [Sediminicoccus rosea]